MRTDELPVESLPSPAASILALHEVTIALALSLTVTVAVSPSSRCTRR